MENFIYTKENAVSPELCEYFIDMFEESDNKTQQNSIASNKFTIDKSGEDHPDVDFTGITFNLDNPNLEDDDWGELLQGLYRILERYTREYREKYIGTKSIADLHVDKIINMQKYSPPNGAFNIYHCERGNAAYSKRVLTWMLYLNDVTDGGGTEFYYQQHVEAPQQGKLVMWSSEWMHLHKGLPSPTQDKYILTGWISFDESDSDSMKLPMKQLEA